MALYVYDHGYRIQTPKDSLFPKRGVNSLKESRASHRSADVEDKLHADGEKFVIPAPDKGPENSDNASRAYASISSEQEYESDSTASLTVSHLMVSPVHTIPPYTPISTAWKRMDSLNISHLIVCEEDQRPLGLISKTDLLEAGPSSVTQVKEIYSQKLIAAAPETRVQDVAINFIENDINSIPVVDKDDKVVGIVCRTDLLRLLVSGPHLERWV
ncbi:HPP family protein [Neptuniibacter caesariensis]|uniref:CBS domain containing membrane protein n=1 Tax=Neptuniibacter caesariensis TaxID=207954 RepID=A0A7U8GRN4_NEPCE|nr:CBS domain-containing protein [Neptuniibacter caesariensis]EAR60536.1 CBS domain containing membrane protein [Oceanospirillum sp. MED92] [Neptuniibacter caesariensis]